MKLLKKVKRGSAICLIFAVLVLCIGTAYCNASDLGEEVKNEQETGIEPELKSEVEINAETEIETEKTIQSETASETQTEFISETEVESDSFSRLETELETQSESKMDTEAELDSEHKPDLETEGKVQTETSLKTESESQAEASTEVETTSNLESETKSETEQETQSESETETDLDQERSTEPEMQSETETESEIETEESETDLSFLLDENWQNCAVYRPGQKMRVASATIHRKEDEVLSYLDFPCYFKYATGHGQDIGEKTLAVYCVYNTREAPKDRLYQPDGKKAFSKEITYCLYNGCRYQGKTAYNPDYSTGNWKKDYYITQIAIHLINHEQGRESSIESYLDKTADAEVYKLVNKMMKDAYADDSLTSSKTNQTKQVTYTISPKTQTKWIRQEDGSWRTAESFTCSSEQKKRVVSVTRILDKNAPDGTTIVVEDENDPLSSFYFQATPAAYRQIAQDNLEITAELTVISEEYGGWWYEPADSSLKRQYITFLSLEAGESEVKPKVSAEADYFEQRASLTVYKEGEMLTGAAASESGIQFQYAVRRLAGAGFELRAGEDIKNGAGELVWKKDAVVASNLVTDANGSVIVEGLYMGIYYLTEKTAPAGTVLNSTPHKVTLTPENDSAELIVSSVTVTNKRQKIQVVVEKKDNTTKHPLSGAVFGVFSGDEIRSVEGNVLATPGDLLGKAVTGADGLAVFTSDLPVGHSYYLKELKAPEGYIRDEKLEYSFSFQNNPTKEIQQVSYSCTNTRCRASLLLQKKDRETGETFSQGDASLTGAVYGLFAREEIRHPDGHTGVLFQKDQQVAVLETDEQAQAEIAQLYLGKYYLKELKAPEGYLLDEKEYDCSFDWQNDQTAVFRKTVVVEDQVKKQAFQIIKGSDKGDADPEALSGAGFTVWLISDLQGADERKTEMVSQEEMGAGEKNKYNTEGAAPVVIGPNGETELFTDEKGYLCTVPLPFGDYLVRETTVPKEHKPVKDFVVTVSEHSPDQPQPWRILLDESFMARLKIIKKDSDSGQTILIPGAEFQVKNLDTGAYVHQETSYPEQKLHTTYLTNEEGYLILPEELPPGRYLIEELTAPEGYVQSGMPLEIVISSDVAFREETSDGEIIFCAEFYDEPVAGEIQIEKRGNVLTGFEGVFQYEEKPLAGVAFEIVAEEDIFSPDRQERLLYKKGTVISTAVTGENGKAIIKELPLGNYRICEKQAPFEFITEEEGMEVRLSYEGQELPVVSKEVFCYNERQQIFVSVMKKDMESEKPLAGAVFGLYAAEDFYDSTGRVIVTAGECLNQVSTGEGGQASFDLNLPHGLYFVKEERAPQGYVTDHLAYELDLRECDGESSVIQEELVLGNQKTQCEISKTDITSGEEIPGATLELRDETGILIERWISGEVPHRIRGLQPGRIYTLTEIQAPYGYLMAESIDFQIKDSGEIQQVEMKDAHVSGKIRIQKEDTDTGEPLAGALFELKDESGKVLEILKTDQKGLAESSLYEIGTYQNGVFTKSLVYKLKEIKAPEGYELDDTEYEIIFPYENGESAEVVWEKTVKNRKTETDVITVKAVRTGDNTDVFGLLCTLFLSGEAILALLFFRKKLR